MIYAEDDDHFMPVEISGIINAGTALKPWMYMLPETYNGSQIKTRKCLLNTNRSKSTYKNEMQGNTVLFCLDKFENSQNHYLKEQVKLKPEMKHAIRVAEIPASGSTSVLDHGDFHVTGLWYKYNKLYGVQLKRLKNQSVLPSGIAFAHYTEKIAFEHMKKILPENEYQIRKESIIINFADKAAMVNGKGIHCYNVDFKIRKFDTAINLGIEVKKDWEAFERDKEENLIKFQKYHEELGAPCLLIIVEPEIRIGIVDNDSKYQDLTHDVKKIIDSFFC